MPTLRSGNNYIIHSDIEDFFRYFFVKLNYFLYTYRNTVLFDYFKTVIHELQKLKIIKKNKNYYTQTNYINKLDEITKDKYWIKCSKLLIDMKKIVRIFQKNQCIICFQKLGIHSFFVCSNKHYVHQICLQNQITYNRHHKCGCCQELFITE